MRISKSTKTDVKASMELPEPTVDNVLKLIDGKKILFKNDVAYWSRGKGVVPKEYRDCIAQTQYAHWINEWSCDQAEKFGDRAYYDYDGETEVSACGEVKCATVNDKALQHIRAAIDILGKSGKKDDVTKDSIANLATVMFDIQGENQ